MRMCGTSRTLTSAWIETVHGGNMGLPSKSRTLTSAWIETGIVLGTQLKEDVALSRVRGLKPWVLIIILLVFTSHSHECVD